jgi:integrase
MASLCSDSGKRGVTYRVITRGPGRKRHTIRLGRINKRMAETARLMIESLESAKAAGHSPDRETAEWVGRLGDEIHSRLARAGLVLPREQASATIVTLGQHLDQLFASLGRQKPHTARNYARARRLLEEFFGKDRTLVSITEGDADAYKRWLLSRYAPASASVDLRRARQYLKAAVRRRLIAVNPFAEVPCGPQVNDDRIYYVSVEDIERVIAACPDSDWRLIFALPRYGGIRFPSEAEDFKWEHVDWENSRFTVHEKKVEHHAGRGRRVVPIFAALRPHLERAYRERAPGAIYVVPRARHGANLGTQAKRIIEKAGVKPWPKLFVNMRGSCSDDLERDGVAEKAINAWVGNTARMRQRHYHAVRPEDWAAVTGKAAQIPARAPSVRGHQEPSTLHAAREKSLDVEDDPKIDYPRQGSKKRGIPGRNGQANSRSSTKSSTRSGSASSHQNDQAMELAERLSSLSPDAVSAILRGFGGPQS